MDYVMLLRWKQGLTREQRDGALMNRAGWKYPAGAEVVAEYWPAAEDPAVVSIFRTDDYGVMMEIADYAQRHAVDFDLASAETLRENALQMRAAALKALFSRARSH